MIGVKVEERFSLEQADMSFSIPGVTFGEWGPGDMGLFLGHPEWKFPPYSQEMNDSWAKVKAACDKAGILWLMDWSDPGMSADEQAEYLINEVGAMILAGQDGEKLAAAGRKLTGREMPV